MGQRFQSLRIWQEAHALTLEVYKLSASFPSEERFGLTAQLRRAAVSVGANIAEGAGRRTMDDFARFLSMARGSVHECQSHLLVARDLGFVSAKNVDALLARFQGLSSGLQKCMEVSRA